MDGRPISKANGLIDDDMVKVIKSYCRYTSTREKDLCIARCKDYILARCFLDDLERKQNCLNTMTELIKFPNLPLSHMMGVLSDHVSELNVAVVKCCIVLAKCRQ